MHTLIFRGALLIASMTAACDQVAEITPRKYVGLIVGHTTPLKLEIAQFLNANPGKPVPQAGSLQLQTPPGIAPMKFDFGWVTSGGAIMIHSKPYAVTVLQEPIQTKGVIQWSCVVHPVEAKPSLCGSD